MNYDVFENLTFSNVKNLYDLCIENESNLSLVKKDYVNNNNNLQETLNFLVDLEILSINENIYSIKKSDDLKNLLFSSLISKPKYSLPLKDYLLNFSSSNDNSIIFKPSLGYNILTSNLRNFLITSKIIKHEIENDCYLLIDHKLLDKIKDYEFSPEELEIEINNQKLIGLEAEKLVFLNEQKNVSNIDKSLKPDHVALRDVSAGYDIKSYLKIDNEIKEIFIEVKAVSSSNYKFHLSAGEYQKAVKNSENYFLYLLPVDYSFREKFNYGELKIINNLDKNIFKNNEWTYQNDGYVIFKNI